MLPPRRHPKTPLFVRSKERHEELNRRHGESRFHLFHRRRRWNAGEAKWMGWERKREWKNLTVSCAALATQVSWSNGRQRSSICDALCNHPRLGTPAAARHVHCRRYPSANRPKVDAITNRVTYGYGDTAATRQHCARKCVTLDLKSASSRSHRYRSYTRQSQTFIRSV